MSGRMDGFVNYMFPASFGFLTAAISPGAMVQGYFCMALGSAIYSFILAKESDA